MLDRKEVEKILEAIGNKVLSVTFTTKDGSEKTYSGRINVVKGRVDTEKSFKVREAFQKNGLVPIKTNKGFRTFSLDKVQSIRSIGLEWM